MDLLEYLLPGFVTYVLGYVFVTRPESRVPIATILGGTGLVLASK